MSSRAQYDNQNRPLNQLSINLTIRIVHRRGTLFWLVGSGLPRRHRPLRLSVALSKPLRPSDKGYFCPPSHPPTHHLRTIRSSSTHSSREPAATTATTIKRVSRFAWRRHSLTLETLRPPSTSRWAQLLTRRLTGIQTNTQAMAEAILHRHRHHMEEEWPRVMLLVPSPLQVLGDTPRHSEAH